MSKRVLIARMDSMGDVLLSGPAIRSVAAQAEVTLLTGPQGTAAGELLPGPKKILTWEAPWISRPGPEPERKVAKKFLKLIQRHRFDQAIILSSFHQSPLPLALLLKFAGVPEVIGASVDYPGTLLDTRLIPGEDFPEDIPEPQRALLIVEAAGYTWVSDTALQILPPADVTKLVPKSPFIVLHPGATAQSRRWPISRFIEAAKIFESRGYVTVVTGSKNEKQLCDQITSANPNTVNLAGKCSLKELAGVIQAADSIVVGNTGPAHLAAAVATPIISLFSPVVPASRWAPYQAPHILLGDQHEACRNTRATQCPVPGHPCLAKVTGQEVVENTIQLIEQTTCPKNLPHTQERVQS